MLSKKTRVNIHSSFLGLAHHPIKSVIEEGASPSGLVGGLTRGLVGVVTKPLGGAAEFVAQTGQGLLVGTGWTQVPIPREASLPQHICSLPSSSLKYEWKLACGSVVLMVEVTTSSMVPATLILTMEAIIIISEEEDCQERVLAVVDTVVQGEDDDPTRLEIFPLEGQQATYDQEDITNERIVQFVRDVRESKLGTKDSSFPYVDKKEEEKLVFFATPITRLAFLDSFRIVKAHLKRFGYPLLL